ncbi:unnamed protein product [Urochloa humidicola]
MAINPELACITRKDGASPLYLAISFGEMEVARQLFDAAQGNLSYSGPGGGNVLHAAAYRGQAVSMVLEWLRRVNNPMAGNIQQQETGQGERPLTTREADLLSKLTSQRDKQQGGSTPLHLAVSSDWWDWDPVQGFLSKRFPHVWPASNSTAALLLDANISTAYQADDYGLYPIHVAAKYGRLGLVKMLLQRCPDCATLRDRKGRTFLHHAAHTGNASVIEHVCQTPNLMTILNAQDREGDTALHRVIRNGNIYAFTCLFKNLQVRLDVANKDGMTPLDLSRSVLPSDFRYSYNPKSIVWKSLLLAGAPYSGGRPEFSRGKRIPRRDLALESEQLARKAQLMSVVAVLIATVAFAAAFTLPGGYRDHGKGGSRKELIKDGTAVLARTSVFDNFILADTLAFLCSILATSTLAYVGVPSLDIHARNQYYMFSCYLLRISGTCLVCAFWVALLISVDLWAKVCVTFLFCSAFIGYNCINFVATIVTAPSAISRKNGHMLSSSLPIEAFLHVLLFMVISLVPKIWARDR